MHKSKFDHVEHRVYTPKGSSANNRGRSGPGGLLGNGHGMGNNEQLYAEQQRGEQMREGYGGAFANTPYDPRSNMSTPYDDS